jgi:hypothetical protein
MAILAPDAAAPGIPGAWTRDLVRSNPPAWAARPHRATSVITCSRGARKPYQANAVPPVTGGVADRLRAPLRGGRAPG